MKLFSFKRLRSKQVFGALTIAAAVVAVPAALFAWGPSRDTYTMAHPADHITFNSITDNSEVGDERQFVAIKDASNTAGGGWQKSIAAESGHEYLVRVYVHNNAASNLNLVATNTRVTAALSTATGTSVPITGYVSADNATPKQVYADVNLTSAQNFNIAYIPGSAMIYNNATGSGGRAVSDSIVNGGGALVGYSANDGNLPGCMQYASYVTFKIKPQFAQTANFTMSKEVSKHGANTWSKSYAAQPGETVDYLVQYKNTGTTQQDNVMISDKLPAGMTYVAGSSVLGNSKYPSGIKTNDGITAGGINVGSYATGANAWVIFSAKVAAKDKLPCGPQTLVNTATVETDYGNKSDTANVTTNGCDCVPPVYTCDMLTVTKLSRTEFKFQTAYTVKDATFKGVTYVVRDANGKEIYRGSNATYTQVTPGTYTVAAYVTVTVNGQDKTVTSNACTKSFTVTQEEKPAVTIVKDVNGKKDAEVNVNTPYVYHVTVTNTGNVDLKDVKVTDPAPKNVTFISADKGTISNNAWSYTIPSLKVKESMTFAITAKVTAQVDGVITNKACVDAPAVPGSPDACDTATVHVPKPGTVQVCNPETGEIITVSEDQASKYKPVNSPECTPVKVCEIATSQVVTIKQSQMDTAKYTTDLSVCTPTVPTELPHTGPSDVLAKISGLVALTSATAYYVASRRNS